jgi:hypothetical protein
MYQSISDETITKTKTNLIYSILRITTVCSLILPVSLVYADPRKNIAYPGAESVTEIPGVSKWKARAKARNASRRLAYRWVLLWAY